MDKATFDAQYQTYLQAVEDYLRGLFTAKTDYDQIFTAMRYSLLAGGKRIRPILTLEFARLCGLDWHKALPVGCALELVHTYSLIHDDLPCMDDDDLRRGKPTSHKQFGETLAILAGDALQPAAFELILSAVDLRDTARANCALILAKAAGADGMVGGQVLDTLCHATTQDQLAQVHRLKTGALLMAACQLGCAAADGDELQLNCAKIYGENLGMAFQIRDDVLDVVGDEADFGKPIGSDEACGKTTYVNLLGIDGCAQAVERCTVTACDAVATWGDDGFLQCLAKSLAGRNH
ncbi:polyprenyl synthetase family protein [Bengtsoniella intestinalis]|uniref:polyprenyl synthetase family protein n=1 Tax=Bengtsoniella intestinalis TaxID=3073143 RepID=UPI00391FA62F